MVSLSPVSQCVRTANMWLLTKRFRDLIAHSFTHSWSHECICYGHWTEFVWNLFQRRAHTHCTKADVSTHFNARTTYEWVHMCVGPLTRILCCESAAPLRTTNMCWAMHYFINALERNIINCIDRIGKRYKSLFIYSMHDFHSFYSLWIFYSFLRFNNQHRASQLLSQAVKCFRREHRRRTTIRIQICDEYSTRKPQGRSSVFR